MSIKEKGMEFRDENRDTAREVGILVMRFAMVVVLVHGIGKLLGVGPAATSPGNFAGFVGSLGFPVPILFAWIVTLTESFGALFIMFGFLTRLSAAFMAINFFVATFLVHLSNGFSAYQPPGSAGFEYTLFLMLISIAVILIGPGRYSIDHKLFEEPTY